MPEIRIFLQSFVVQFLIYILSALATLSATAIKQASPAMGKDKKLPEGKGERKKFYSDWLKRLDAQRQIADEKIESLESKKRKELDKAADGLKIWRSNRNQIEEWKYFGDEAEIQRQTGQNSKEWLEQADNMIPYLERRCRTLFTEYNPKISPITVVRKVFRINKEKP